VCCGTQLQRGPDILDTTVWRCSGCGLRFCSPLPVFNSSSAGCNSTMTAEEYTQAMLFPSAQRSKRYSTLAQERYQIYAHELGRRRFRLLEIGCGTAALAPCWIGSGVDYQGVDIDNRVVEYARKNLGPKVACLDFMDLPELERFDVICFSQVLEHIVRPRDFIAKVRRHLLPGGLIHCDVPNDNSLSSLVHKVVSTRKRERYGAVEYPHHLHAYCRRTLSRLLSPHFRARVFTAALTDPGWGQATDLSASQYVYAWLSRSLRAGSLLVALGCAIS
jgi:2-polyprenyl-3-methyl-5-hydroxy-6-metoxy-1,4-benzoquinol methylase